MPITALQAVGYAKESTYGQFTSPTRFVPCNSADIQTTRKVERPQQMRAHRGQVIDALVGEETGINITADLVPTPLGDLIAGAFGVGSDTVSGSAGVGYTHVLTPKNDLPSYSFEVSHDEHTQLLSRQVVGCMVDSFTIRAAAQQLASFEASLIGQTEITPATPGIPSFATPTFPLVQPLDFSSALLTYAGNGDSNITEFSFGISNAVQRVFTGNQKLYVRRLVPTRREVTLTASFDFVNLDQYTDWKDAAYINGVTCSFVARENIPGTSTPWQLDFTVRRLRAMDQFSLQSANDVLNAPLSFSATVGPHNDEVTATIITGDSGAYA